jgi:hypothetical protein
MGKPLVLYGQPNLLNHSFESDADEAAPSDWDIASYSNNGENKVDTAFFHSAGVGYPSTRSLRQNINGANVTYSAVATQRIQADDLLTILKARDLEFGAAAMVRYGKPVAEKNASIELLQYQGTTLTIAEGTLKTPPSTRKFITGKGPEWLMYVVGQKLHADTNRIEIRLRYDIAVVGDYDADADVWWDRVFMGGLIDFSKGLADYDTTGMTGYVVNQGDGVAELVKVYTSSADISIAINNIVEDSDLDNQIKGLQQLTGSDTPGKTALWVDRDKFTNGERHYQFLIADPKTPKIDYPKGFNRRNYKYKFLAYTEYTD